MTSKILKPFIKIKRAREQNLKWNQALIVFMYAFHAILDMWCKSLSKKSRTEPSSVEGFDWMSFMWVDSWICVDLLLLFMLLLNDLNNFMLIFIETFRKKKSTRNTKKRFNYNHRLKITCKTSRSNQFTATYTRRRGDNQDMTIHIRSTISVADYKSLNMWPFRE